MNFKIRYCVAVISMALVLPLPLIAKTVEHTLDNGLKVVVKTDDRAPVVVSQLWYRVGSMDELNSRTGLSHLLEHLMFKGTKEVPSGEFNRQIAAAGGQLNAFTSRDYTVYHEQIAADKLPLALRLEADRMNNLNFSDKEFKSELQVVKEERRMRTDDQATSTLMEQLYASAYIANPIRVPVIGWMNDLNHVTAADAHWWYNTWYAPNNATLVVVGNVKPEEVFNEAKKYFANLTKKKLLERREQLEPEQKGIRRIQVKAVSELPYLVMAYKAPHLHKVSERAPYALFMLSAVLDGQSASRLARVLVREKRLATSVSCDYDMMGRGGSLFLLSGIPAHGVSIANLEKALRSEIGKIAKNGVKPFELERIRRQVEAGRIYAKDSIAAQASQIGRLESLGFAWSDEQKIDDALKTVTPAEVQAAAQSLIDDNLTVAVLNPQKPDKNAKPKDMAPIGSGDVK